MKYKIVYSNVKGIQSKNPKSGKNLLSRIIKTLSDDKYYIILHSGSGESDNLNKVAEDVVTALGVDKKEADSLGWDSHVLDTTGFTIFSTDKSLLDKSMENDKYPLRRLPWLGRCVNIYTKKPSKSSDEEVPEITRTNDFMVEASHGKGKRFTLVLTDDDNYDNDDTNKKRVFSTKLRRFSSGQRYTESKERDLFNRYHRVQREGKYNMIMDARDAAEDAGLSMDEYRYVLDNYRKLYDKYFK